MASQASVTQPTAMDPAEEALNAKIVNDEPLARLHYHTLINLGEVRSALYESNYVKLKSLLGGRQTMGSIAQHLTMDIFRLESLSKHAMGISCALIAIMTVGVNFGQHLMRNLTGNVASDFIGDTANATSWVFDGTPYKATFWVVTAFYAFLMWFAVKSFLVFYRSDELDFKRALLIRVNSFLVDMTASQMNSKEQSLTGYPVSVVSSVEQLLAMARSLAQKESSDVAQLLRDACTLAEPQPSVATSAAVAQIPNATPSTDQS